ncbi:unnamed protein product [Didymodactylos carnosus]|uniref:Uncharacterized protein n=1 Tax=Didymodactylos carnosus TaxID=1234261 RepID=A0A814IGS2_9BILA|nr:unnamed protein product [Didymodactylos carnosus]CAF1464932.1 unnamed protein product [Didymodactylos carnosus]CAF3796819.1 unnamed protein product [Didymodactylos carnosus]CAF4257800.1 unnamed protein product [Didymodactylos carnosus]
MKMALHNINKTLITLIVLAVVITASFAAPAAGGDNLVVASSKQRKRREADLTPYVVLLGFDSDYALFTYDGGDGLAVLASHADGQSVNGDGGSVSVGTMNVHLLSIVGILAGEHKGVDSSGKEQSIYPSWTMAYAPAVTNGLWTHPGVVTPSLSVVLGSNQSFSLQNDGIDNLNFYTHDSSGKTSLAGTATYAKPLAVSITFQSSNGTSGNATVLMLANILPLF